MRTLSHTCAGVDGDVVIGTLFSWRHPNDAPRVGAYRSDAGQLVWTSRSAEATERGFAVLVEGRQVHVREVTELLTTHPAKLLVAYVPAGAPRAEQAAQAEITLASILERVLEDFESVVANRVV